MVSPGPDRPERILLHHSSSTTQRAVLLVDFISRLHGISQRAASRQLCTPIWDITVYRLKECYETINVQLRVHPPVRSTVRYRLPLEAQTAIRVGTRLRTGLS